MTGFIDTFLYNQSQQLTIDDCLRLAPFWLDYDCLLLASFFYCDWLGSDLRIVHFFIFLCPLGNTPQLNTQSNSASELMNSLTTESRLNKFITCPFFIPHGRTEQISQFPRVHVFASLSIPAETCFNFVVMLWFLKDQVRYQETRLSSRCLAMNVFCGASLTAHFRRSCIMLQ
jgi:hypothetical protein